MVSKMVQNDPSPKKIALISNASNVVCMYLCMYYVCVCVCVCVCVPTAINRRLFHALRAVLYCRSLKTHLHAH